MSIVVTKEPDVYVTGEELRRYEYEYQRAFQFYAGPLPSLEEFIRQRQARYADPMRGWKAG